jgi:hypothetical protein
MRYLTGYEAAFCRSGLRILALCSVAASPLSAVDFSFCGLGKGTYFDQTQGGAPVPKLSAPYLMYARVAATGSGVFVKLVPPIGFPRDLNRLSPLTAFELWDRKATPATLDSAYPAGIYLFDIGTFSSGHQYVTNHLANGSLPNAPSISNLVEAQAVDSENDFTLSWNAFVGGTAADFTSCEIWVSGGPLFATPSLGMPGALDGTATSVLIPGFTLLSGRAFLGRLRFAKVQELYVDAASQATVATFLFSQTDFWLRTIGGTDNTPPTITWTSVTNGANNVPTNLPIGVRFSEAVQPYFDYHITGVGNSGTRSLAFSPDFFEVVLTPNNPPSPGATCKIIFNPLEGQLGGFKDTNGNPLAAETLVASFTVGNFRLNPTRARLLNPVWQDNGTFEVDLEGEPYFFHRLESSTNLTAWSTVSSNIAFSGTAHFVDTNAAPERPRIYRAVSR